MSLEYYKPTDLLCMQVIICTYYASTDAEKGSHDGTSWVGSYLTFQSPNRRSSERCIFSFIDVDPMNSQLFEIQNDVFYTTNTGKRPTGLIHFRGDPVWRTQYDTHWNRSSLEVRNLGPLKPEEVIYLTFPKTTGIYPNRTGRAFSPNILVGGDTYLWQCPRQ